jgi:hypothetical protein
MLFMSTLLHGFGLCPESSDGVFIGRICASKRCATPDSTENENLQFFLLEGLAGDFLDKMPGNAYDAFVVAHHHVPGIDGNTGASDGNVQIDGVV